MKYRLREGLYFAQVKGRNIFLDIKIDRYFGLTEVMEGAFQCLAGGGNLAPRQIEILQPLFRRGLLVEDKGGGPPKPMVSSKAEVGVPVNRRQRAPLISVLNAMRIQSSNNLSLHTRSLSWSIERIKEKKAKTIRNGEIPREEFLRDTVDMFASAEIIISSHNKCLIKALSIADYVISRGYSADIYFGVQIPFAAHSWVQCGRAVVGDTPDRVSAYTPILVV